MDDQKAKALVASLVSATSSGQVPWKQNATKDGFLAVVDGMTVELRLLGQGRGTLRQLATDQFAEQLKKQIYELEVRNEVGNPIANLRDELPGSAEVLLGIAALAPELYGLRGLYVAIDKAGDAEIDKLIKALRLRR